MKKTRDKLTETLGFFDANIWLGIPEGFSLSRELSPGNIKKVLGDYHITGGLISHWRGKKISAQDGNSALSGITGFIPKDCYLIWTGLPLFPREKGPLPGIGRPSSRLAGVRIFPKSHNFPLAEWTLNSLCSWLLKHCLPLFIWHTEIDWSSLRQLAITFPRLTIVIESQPQKILYQTRPLFALMRDCRNITVEISNLAGQGLIEYVVEEFGAHRLLFGSFLPMNDPLVPIGMILDADITKKEKKLIAGGNFRQLIKGITL